MKINLNKCLVCFDMSKKRKYDEYEIYLYVYPVAGRCDNRYIRNF